MNMKLLTTSLLLLLAILLGGMLSFTYLSRTMPSWCLPDNKTLLKPIELSSSVIMMEVSGMPILVDVRDKYISSELAISDNVAIDKIVDTILQPGDSVLEVGTGFGYFALQEARKIGKNGKLFIISANSKSLPLLAMNLKINDFYSFAKIIYGMPYPHNNPLLIERFTDSMYKYRILLNQNDASSKSNEIETIAPIIIDQVLPAGTNLKLIRLNCYGSELKVLSTAEMILRSSPKVSIIINWDHQAIAYYGNQAQILEQLRFLKFDFWNIKADSSTELLTIDKLLNNSYDNVLITRMAIPFT